MLSFITLNVYVKKIEKCYEVTFYSSKKTRLVIRR